MEPLLNITEVAHLLGRRPQTLKRDLCRNPMAVPPRVELPGTRLLRWRAADVELWIALHAMTNAARGTKHCPCQRNGGSTAKDMVLSSREAI